MVRFALCVFCGVLLQNAKVITMLRQNPDLQRTQQCCAAFLSADVITMQRNLNCVFCMQINAKRMCDYNADLTKMHQLAKS